MSPAALAATLAALGGGSRFEAIGDAAAAISTACTAPAPAAMASEPGPTASNPAAAAPNEHASEPGSASRSLSSSVLHSAAQAPLQAGAAPWEQLIAECGFGPVSARAEPPQSGVISAADPHGWNAILAELGLHRPGLQF